MNWIPRLSRNLKKFYGGVLAALALAACSGGANTGPSSPTAVASVGVLPAVDTGVVGSTLNFTASVKDSVGLPLSGTVTWTVSDTMIASVDREGVVTTYEPGTVTLSASYGTKLGTAAVIVTGHPVATISVAPATSVLSIGASVQLTGTSKDAAGNTLSGRKLTWASTNAAVASVSASGLVTAVGVGTASLTAIVYNGTMGTASVTVTSGQVATVSLSPSAVSLIIGTTAQLAATPKDLAGNIVTGGVVSWASNNVAIAAVSAAGLVTAMGAGSATITATSGGRSGTAAVTVLAPTTVASVTVTPASNALIVGATVQLTATPKDSVGNVITGRSVAWSSSNASVATVSATGLVSAIAAGSTSITATIGGTPGTAQVSATAAAAPGTFLTPNLVNNASFETGWDFFTNGSAATPTGVSRDGTHAYAGSMAVKRTLLANAGHDTSADLYYAFSYGSAWGLPTAPQTLDRIYSRFWFYFDAPINGTFKFQIYEAAGFNGQFGGLYLHGGVLAWVFTPEVNTQFINLAPLSGLTNGWHSLEVDYWRNGDPSGNPTVGLWLDNVAITQSMGATPAPAVWVGGRLSAGQRLSSAKIGTYNLLGILNGGPANTIAGNVWIDRVAVSSLGRVGP